MQTITTPGGETLVVLPLDEYKALLDARDVTEAKGVQVDIAAGRDELVPESIVKRLIAGESPIRVWREHRGMSARDLAQAADVSAAYVSEIETGKKEGSIAVIKRIANALKVDIDDLV